MFWTSYAWGFKSLAAALDALDDEIAEGRLSEVDCRIRAYKTTEGARRWQIEELAPA
jgi:soluble cytochrome b562